MDKTLERLAREDRQNELCRLQSEVARLKLALDAANSEAAVSAAEERDAKECLSVANDGLPMDMVLWAVLKRQRDDAVVALRNLCDADSAMPTRPRTFPENRLIRARSAARMLLAEIAPESKPDA